MEIRQNTVSLEQEADHLRRWTPLGAIDLLQKEDKQPRNWMAKLRENVSRLAPLPELVAEKEACQLPATPAATLADFLPIHPVPPKTSPPPREISEIAGYRLQTLGVLTGREMRHENSLAPVGLTRGWFLQREVHNQEISYSLYGTQTSYGRGTDLESARVGLIMEIVERYSSFASMFKERIQYLSGKNEIIRGSYSRFIAQGENCLDPETMFPDYPYHDEELTWMYGRQTDPNGQREILFPVQLAFLFSNLHEKALFAAPPSTGLAAGITEEQAKLNALLEVLERDALALGLFTPKDCFRLRSIPDSLKEKTKNTDVVLQDISTPLGIPAYKAFVRDREGTCHAGSSAHLCGARAALSAIMETPLPPDRELQKKTLDSEIEEREWGNLPDYSSGAPHKDLEILLQLLVRNGYRPIFADLTRRDLGFPVARAIVPGLEPGTDFDSYRRTTPRLWQSYRSKTNRTEKSGAKIRTGLRDSLSPGGRMPS